METLIFDKILEDLKNPQKAIKPTKVKFSKIDTYTIYSLVTGKETDAAHSKDFIIKSEEYGIPQARHRVILLGIRDDQDAKPTALKKQRHTVSVADVISDLPKLRSVLSKLEDNHANWEKEIKKYNS